MSRPSWDQFGISVAKAVSSRGDCKRSRVGAVILDRNHKPLGWGYNGTEESGVLGCLDGACPRGQKTYGELPPGGSYESCIAVHAEANAVRWTEDKSRLDGATVYVTRECCSGCYELLALWKVRRVVWPNEEYDNWLTWDWDPGHVPPEFFETILGDQDDN